MARLTVTAGIVKPSVRHDRGMEIHGFADARFLPVRDCFADIAAAQAGTGAALAAYCAGRLVVDLRGGYADQARRRPWDARSLVQPYPVSKPFAAVLPWPAGSPGLWSGSVAGPAGLGLSR